ncbi:MAG: DNA-binding response regulator, partial [Deltaproteobacteria bacterium]|nr:DNA-binding response regulator [Deltaproteobacteria bacterium]
MARTILVVDDEETILQSLDGILTDEGFDAITVQSGAEALEKIDEV